MFNGHTMSVVTDLNILGPAINDDEIIIAAITTGQYPTLPNVYNASILVPPTEVLMQWADGNPYILQNQYPNYLLCKEPDDMIVAFIAAMTKYNVVLYIPIDDFNVFGMILLNHIQFIYGITCNFMTTQFYVDQNKIPLIVSKFFMLGVMDAQDYLDAYPGNYMLPEYVIPKLMQEMPIPNPLLDPISYYNELNANKIQSDPPKVMATFVGGNKDK